MDPYPDDGAHLADNLARIDVLLYRYLETWRAESAGDGDVPGLYVSDAEVEQILAGDRTETKQSTDATDRPAELREVIDERVTVTEAVGIDLRLRTLADRFDLSDRHVDALLLAVAPELDLDYEKVFAYLQDDFTRKRPTVGLVARVLGSAGRGALDERYRLSESSPLVSNSLVRLRPPEPEAPLLAASVTADRRVVAYLLGSDDVDPSIAECTAVLEPETMVGDLPLDDEVRRDVERAVPAADQPPTMVTLSGPMGVGKRDAVAAMAARFDRPLVRTDAGRVLTSDCADPADRVCREARLRDAVVHLTNVHRLDEETDQNIGAETIARKFDDFLDHVFLSGEHDWQPPRDVDSHTITTLRLSRPGYERRKELWDRRLTDHSVDLDTADLAATFSLTRGQIDDAIEQAHSYGTDGLSSESVYDACRAQSRETLGDLAMRSEPTYTWDDIVLPADELRQLRAVAAHISHRGTVYADWGFEDHFNLGTGLNVLFSGPSGTGKTMAAEILANEAGLDLFKIDLASVVSKYIGETEKHLKHIFDEAEHSDALLFFDEADALFGERSEVSDSHDRYANVEVSYLLQRMEEHDGTVIMTTNLEENIDDAFQRRINRTVEFPRPNHASRYAIWEGIFPAETPIGDLDYEFLSSFDLTGGNVENIALTAAFLAADDEGLVEMIHVVRALRRELQKTGRLVSADEFGEYGELLR